MPLRLGECRIRADQRDMRDHVAERPSLSSSMRAQTRTIGAIVLSAAMAWAPAASAQQADSSLVPGAPRYWWVGGALTLVAAASDQALERHSLAHRSATLNDLAAIGDQLGRGKLLIPALGASYLASRLARNPGAAATVTHAAAAYLLGDVIMGIGKPLIGRHRPDTTGSPWRFRPVSFRGEWHATPSGHTLHAFTLAGAIAEEARRPWVTVAAYGTAALVGWSRTYHDEHWGSDVVLSAFVGAALGHATVRWLHRRTRPPSPRPLARPDTGAMPPFARRAGSPSG